MFTSVNRDFKLYVNIGNRKKNDKDQDYRHACSLLKTILPYRGVLFLLI